VLLFTCYNSNKYIQLLQLQMEDDDVIEVMKEQTGGLLIDVA